MATHSDSYNPGRLIGRSEVERREVYMKKLENLLLESHPILVEMVTNCLHNTPQTRPTAEQLLETLTPVQDAMENIHGGSLGRTINIVNVLHMKETKERNNRIKELEVMSICELQSFVKSTIIVNTIIMLLTLSHRNLYYLTFSFFHFLCV